MRNRSIVSEWRRADVLRRVEAEKRKVEVLAIVMKADAEVWLSTVGERPGKRWLYPHARTTLSPFLRLAEKEEVVVTRHGKTAGVLIGFRSGDDAPSCPFRW